MRSKPITHGERSEAVWEHLGASEGPSSAMQAMVEPLQAVQKPQARRLVIAIKNHYQLWGRERPARCTPTGLH